MKIYIFLINKSSIGGIEKVANNLSIILSEYSDSVDVEVIDIADLKVLYGDHSEFLLCVKFIKDIVESDLILSLYDRLSIQLSFAKIYLKTNIKLVACQHADFYANRIHTRILRRIFYCATNQIVALTSADYDLYVKSRFKNVAIIPNPISFYPKTIPLFSSRANSVVAAGRLSKVKAFNNVINLAVIMSDIESVGFSIYGDGEEREALSLYANSMGVCDNILRGSTSKLDDIFLVSKFLVVTSLRESFSMVILEAMAAGCIPISFDCPTGPREIIDDGVNGFLVPMGDIFKIKNTVEMLMNNPVLAEEISFNARLKASLYTKDNILSMWRRIIDEL